MVVSSADVQVRAQTKQRLAQTLLVMVRREWVAIALCVLALGLRLWGINFGLPYSYHPDEHVVNGTAVQMLHNGTANPGTFTYPSGLYYILVCILALYQFVTGHTVGTPPSESGIGLYPEPNAILLTRIAVALFGVAAVLIVYLAARMFTGPWLAAGGALLLAVSTSSIMQSQIATTDLPSATGLVLTAACCVLAVRTERAWPFWCAGAALGIAAGLKYNVATGGVMLAVAYAIVAWRRMHRHDHESWRALWRDPRLWGFLLAPLAFLVTTPYAIPDFHKFVSDLIAVKQHYDVVGHPGAEGNTLAFTLNAMFRSNETAISVLACVGVVHALVKRRAEPLIIFAGAAVYFIVIATPKVHFGRNLIPLWPLLALLAAEGLFGLASALSAIKPYLTTPLAALRKRSLANVIVACLFIICFVPSVASSVRADSLRSSTDVRTTATEWVAQNIPAGTHIAIEGYSVTLDHQKYDETYMGCGLFTKPLDWYVENHIQYAVASSLSYKRYVDSTAYPLQRLAYLTMFNEWPLVKKWVGIDTAGAATGATIMILRVQPPTSPVPASLNNQNIALCPI